ncbi:hypothetical protein RI367_006655 [Sorochytrium milnesiophthora]
MVTNPNDTATTKAAGALATLSSGMDPYPHYFMGGASALGSYYAYSSMKNSRGALIAGLCSLAYMYAGYQIGMGQQKLGYDVGTMSSLALTAATGRRAYETGEQWSTVMASLGGVSSIGNLTKSYQMRTGKPKELRMG